MDDLGLPYTTGATVTNPDLANALQQIAEGGAEAFYTGPMAEAMVEVVQKYGGLLTMEDLAN